MKRLLLALSIVPLTLSGIAGCAVDAAPSDDDDVPNLTGGVHAEINRDGKDIGETTSDVGETAHRLQASGCTGCGPVPDPWKSVAGPVPDPWTPDKPTEPAGPDPDKSKGKRKH